MKIKNFLWLFPFLAFWTGYIILGHFFSIKTIKTPSLIGKNLESALTSLSQKKVNLRILTKKLEPDLPSGTIISQNPRPGAAIKQNQPVYCAISQKLPAIFAPDCFNKTERVSKKNLSSLGIKPKCYYLPSSIPQTHCFAQFQIPHEPIRDNQIILYISAGTEKPLIMPNFKGYSTQEVVSFLEPYGIAPDIIRSFNSHNQESLVIDQRPLPGSLITIDAQKTLRIQLQVQ